MLDEETIISTIEQTLKIKIKSSSVSLFLYPNSFNGVEVLYIAFKLACIYSVDFEELIISLSDVTVSVENICNIIEKLQQ